MRTLGIDLGTNSFGWSLIETNGELGENITQGQIVASGARIFSQSDFAGRNPKSMASLAVARREARGTRRRRDRYLRRREELLEKLIHLGLLPSNEDKRKTVLRETDDGPEGNLQTGVYAVRAKAANEQIPAYLLGRVFFQLNQRRGFKSNRKTNKGDNEAGKINIAASRLDHEMMAAGAKTYGIFLQQRREKGLSVRTRLRPETGDGAKGTGYDFYPTRALLEREFDIIAAEQSKYHAQILTESNIVKLRKVIFDQRPLKKPLVGKCSYNPGEERLPKAHPLYQQFRLYKEVNELKLIGEQQQQLRLTPDQRDRLILELRGKREVSFSVLRKRLKLGTEWRFNKESENRTKLLGDEVSASLMAEDRFGSQWNELTPDQQAEIVNQLLDVEDGDILAKWLIKNHSLDSEAAENIATVNLPTGYARIGEGAAKNLLEALKSELDDKGFVITEAEASQRVYGKTNSERDLNAPGLALLPPYQEVLTRNIPPGAGGNEPVYDKRMGSHHQSHCAHRAQPTPQSCEPGHQGPR